MNRLMLLVLVGVAVLLLGAGEYKQLKTGDFSYPTTVTGNISDSGDTARIVKIEPKVALDSYEYVCTLTIPLLAADSIHDVSWTSPLQIMIWTLAGNTGDLLNADTVGIGVVGCTATLAGGDLGMEYDLGTGHDSTIATALDSICAIWNAVSGLDDSIDMEDSGSYIKMVSKFSELTYTAKWGIKMSTDSTDTASQNPLSIAVAIDSLVATANAADSGADYVTASDSTTYYMITSDDKGLPFFLQAASGFHADTLDTTHTQLNVVSRFIADDTVLVGASDGFSTLQGRVILRDGVTPEALSSGCLKNDDSARVWVYANRGGSFYLVDSGLCAAIPCTLDVEIPGVVGDTLLEHDLYVRFWRDDSCTANTTPDTYTQNIYWDFKLK